MGLIEDIEGEVGPLGEAERWMVEREVDLLAAFAVALAGRIPDDASEEERQAAITEQLHDDAELFEVLPEDRRQPLQPGKFSCARLTA